MEPPPEYVAEQARPFLRRSVVLPAFAVVSLVGGLFPSFSLAANLYVLVVGGVLTWLGVSGMVARAPRIATPRRLTRGALWWLLPVGVFALFEIVSFGLGSTYAHPTVSVLLAGPLSSYAGRAAGYFVWLCVFWGLVRR